MALCGRDHGSGAPRDSVCLCRGPCLLHRPQSQHRGAFGRLGTLASASSTVMPRGATESSKEKALRSVSQQTKGKRSCVQGPGCPGPSWGWGGTRPLLPALSTLSYCPGLCLQLHLRGLLLNTVLSNQVHQKAGLCSFGDRGNVCVSCNLTTPGSGATQPNPSTEKKKKTTKTCDISLEDCSYYMKRSGKIAWTQPRGQE